MFGGSRNLSELDRVRNEVKDDVSETVVTATFRSWIESEMKEETT
jgi:hypothetical protein